MEKFGIHFIIYYRAVNPPNRNPVKSKSKFHTNPRLLSPKSSLKLKLSQIRKNEK